jgi:aldehyde:ferredoxin oxidoreductase
MNDKIYRADLSKMKAWIEDVPESWNSLGGRGLTSAVVASEVEPLCHPLGKNNKLVFAPGLLSGTTAANTGRLSAGGKSPLTKGIKESNSGGTSAQLFARAGIKALIIEGLPENKNEFYGIRIKKDSIEIEKTSLWGKGNFETIETLSKGNEKCGVISIGAAGEMKMAAANISVKDPQGKIRSLGRGGLGAVMGSKNVKYVVIEPTENDQVYVENPEKFKEAAKSFAKALLEHPVSGEGLPTYGTNILTNVLHEAGGLPTKNFSTGNFDGHDKISGETMHDLIEERGGKVKHGCHPGCVIQCSQVYNDKNGNYLTSGFEYETIWATGANCKISDLDSLAYADHLMDDIGIDTIETGAAVAVAMDAGVLEFGDSKGFVNLLEQEIKNGTPLGRIVGAGAEVTGKVFGVTRVPVVKGQALPAYDPRAVKGMGITYATSPMGADHTAGYCVTSNILSVGGYVDPLKKDGQIELSRNLQIATASLDTAGLCIFTAFAILDNEKAMEAIVDMLNAKSGSSITGDDVMSLGASVLKMEREFNKKAGFNEKDDRLPEFFSLEKCPPHNVIWDFTDEEIDSFWNF